MEAEQILKRIGYDNNSITATEMWIAKEVYRLAMEDAAALRQPLVSGRLFSDELICKAQNDVAYKWLDEKGKIDFESGVLTGYNIAINDR